MRIRHALLGALLAATAAGHVTSARQGALPAAPILFATQVPTPEAEAMWNDLQGWIDRRLLNVAGAAQTDTAGKGRP